MALIDKASLLMVPSTYEAGTLYNVLPSGNRAPDSTDQNSGYDQTRADFDFDRGSNTAATRVNADGLIEKYRENLFTQSNNFSDSDWSPKAGTFAQGIEDPNGGNDAWSWTATNTDPYLYQAIGTSGVFTLSIYAKGVGSTIGKVLELRNGSTTQNFTLTSEWQRFELYASAGGSNIGFEFGNPAVIGDVMYIYAAQWETGVVATDYLDSTSVTGKAGVLVDLPRINYDANGENGSLLLEPSRKNLVAFSEYLNGGIWIQTGSSVTDNDATSPEGLTNAAKVQGDGSQTYIRLYDNLTYPSTGNYTLSVFAKAGNNDFLRIQFGGVTGAQNAYFDLVNGTTAQSWATIEPVGTDGWYRCSVTADLTGPDLTGNYNFYVSYSYTTSTFPSAGDANGQYVYLYGAQLEASATYASSYIPNHGESGGVTRAADSCSVTGASDVIGQTEGTIYAEINVADIESFGTYSAVRIYDGTSNNEIAFIFYTNGRVQATAFSGGSLVVNINDGDYGLSSGVHKVAFAYKANDYAFYIDGSVVGTDASASVPATNQIDLFYNNVGSLNHNQTALFNERLSNAELATLTTL